MWQRATWGFEVRRAEVTSVIVFIVHPSPSIFRKFYDGAADNLCSERQVRASMGAALGIAARKDPLGHDQPCKKLNSSEEAEEEEHRPSLHSFITVFSSLALGDAIGAIMEGNPPSECARIFDTEVMALFLFLSRPSTSSSSDVVELASLLRPLQRHFPFGQVTDDSQLAREVGFAIVDAATNGCIAPPDFIDKFGSFSAHRMMVLYKSHKMVGAGATTAKSLTKLIRGTHTHLESGTAGFGNSPLIRATSLALYFYDPMLFSSSAEDDASPTSVSPALDRLVKAVRLQSQITHSSYVVSDCALVFALSLALCLHQRQSSTRALPPPPLCAASFLSSLRRSCSLLPLSADVVSSVLAPSSPLLSALSLPAGGISSQMSSFVSGALLGGRRTTALSLLGTVGCSPSAAAAIGPVEATGVNGDALSSLAWALWSFLTIATRPTEWGTGGRQATIRVLREAVKGGGDADSTGALAGALAGAFFGERLGRIESLIEDLGNKGGGMDVVAKELFAAAQTGARAA